MTPIHAPMYRGRTPFSTSYILIYPAGVREHLT